MKICEPRIVSEINVLFPLWYSSEYRTKHFFSLQFPIFQVNFISKKKPSQHLQIFSQTSSFQGYLPWPRYLRLQVSSWTLCSPWIFPVPPPLFFFFFGSICCHLRDTFFFLSVHLVILSFPLPHSTAKVMKAQGSMCFGPHCVLSTSIHACHDVSTVGA